MPFGQNTSPQKFYVFDSTSEFGFVFQIVSHVGARRQYTDYFTKLGPLLIAVPGRTGSYLSTRPPRQVVIIATYVRAYP